MNRVTLTYHTLAFDSQKKKQLIGPIIFMICCLLFVIISILFYLRSNTQGFLTNRVSNSVISIIQDQETLDLSSLSKHPTPADDLPIITTDTAPAFAFSAAYAQSDLWHLVYFGADEDRLLQQHEIEFIMTSTDRGVVIVEPTNSLQAGIYCFYERDWFDRSSLPTHYCFEMKG